MKSIMRKNIILIAFAAFAAFLSSCDRKAEFRSESFATFEAVKYSVSETDGSFEIPVSIYNPTDEEVQLIVRTKDSTAVADKDFSIVYPVSGVLTFAPGESTQNIEIELVHDRDTTGSKIFEVILESADDGLPVGRYDTATCKIKDKEHPLEKFIGEWTGDIFDLSANMETVLNVTISEDEYDETFTKLRIQNLDPISSIMSKTYTLRATVNKDHTRITIASEQPLGYYEAYDTYYTFYAFSVSMLGEVYLADSVTLVYDPVKETLTIANPYGTLFTYTDGVQYIGSLYSSDAVLKKK